MKSLTFSNRGQIFSQLFRSSLIPLFVFAAPATRVHASGLDAGWRKRWCPPALSLTPPSRGNAEEQARLRAIRENFKRSGRVGSTVVDSLMTLFENRSFVPDHGRVLVLDGSLNYYEFLLPLVNPTVTVYFEPENTELYEALISTDWYLVHILLHLRKNNPRLWEKIGRPTRANFGALIARRVKLDLGKRKAHLVFARDPKSLPPDLDARAEAGGFYWFRISEYSPPIPEAILQYSSVPLDEPEVREVADFGHRRVPGGPRLDHVSGRTGAEDFPGVSLLFMKPR